MKRDLEALARLREWLKPGDTVHTVLRHVSRSGMQREISLLHTSCENGEPVTRDLTYNASRALGERIGKRDGIVMGGCGMDMGFALVYSLSSELFPEGFGCIGERCPANDHANGDRDYTPGHAHPRAGGYALRQRWI